jgi:hypothetical protein
MRAVNGMTNTLGLVETVSTTRWDMITLNVPNGFSLEVFRGGRHLASITSQNMERRWDFGVLMRGDTIHKVNLGYRYKAFQGQLYSSDGFVRAYEIDLRLYVSNPTLFAVQYLQMSDPILLVHKEIERILELYARPLNHNSMNEEHIYEIANREFSSAAQHCSGVSVDQISVHLSLDPSYRAVLDIRKNTMVEEVRLNEQTYLEDISLRNQTPLQRRRDELKRESEIQFTVHHIRKAELEDQYTRRQTVQGAFTRGMADRIADQLNRGYSMEEILRSNPELSDALGTSPQNQIASPTFNEEYALLPERSSRPGDPLALPPRSVQATERRQSAEDTDSSQMQNPLKAPSIRVGARRHPGQPNEEPVNFTGNESPSIRTKARRQTIDSNAGIIEAEVKQLPPQDETPVAIIKVKAQRNLSQQSNVTGEADEKYQPTGPVTSTFHSTHLGVTLAAISETQRQSLPFNVASSIMFVVISVDPNGPTRRNMLIGDFLVEVADQQILSEYSLIQLLSGYHEKDLVTIRVLRDGQYLDLVDIKVAQTH